VTSNEISTKGRILLPAFVAAFAVMLPVLASGQAAPVYCDDCPRIAADALQRCLRSSPSPLCASVARQVRENCDTLCVRRPTTVVCPAKNVQHWNKIVFRVPKDRRIERDGTVAGTTNSLAEVIVRSEPNEMLDPFLYVTRIVELRNFCVIVLDANGQDMERRCNEHLRRSDIEIADIEYSTICAEEQAPANPPQASEPPK
jgi:hypothetical protein